MTSNYLIISKKSPNGKVETELIQKQQPLIKN